jgi:hypothetical protein
MSSNLNTFGHGELSHYELTEEELGQASGGDTKNTGPTTYQQLESEGGGVGSVNTATRHPVVAL